MASNPAKPDTNRVQRLAAAGYAGSREFANQFGLSLIALEQIGRLSAQQMRWFVEDQRESAELLATSLNPLTTALDHLVRRSRHVQRGIEDFAGTLHDLAERSATLRRHVWAPLAESTGLANVATFEGRGPSRVSILARLHEDHRRLAKVLDVLESLSDGAAPAPEHLDLLRSALEYVAEYPDAVHHPLEDRLFEHLLGVDLSAAEREDVAENAAHHGKLVAATSRLRHELQALPGSGGVGWEALRHELRDFLEAQREHMRFEERRVFPLAERKLPARALREVGHDAIGRDPLFDTQLEHFAALYDHVTGSL